MVNVSVIVPVYNVEKKLSRCIDSLSEQAFSDYEVILVNDGSEDSSGDICDAYAKKDDRLRVIHQKNQGVSAARNKGILEAKGSYITFVDSDDYVDERFLSSLYSLAEHEHVDIAVCSYSDVSGKNITPIWHGFQSGTVFGRKEIQSILYNNIIKNDTRGYYSMCNKMFRRSMLIQEGILLDTTMSFGEDMIFILDCLKVCNKIGFVEQSFYFYERTEGGLFSSYRQTFLDDIIKCYKRIIEQVDNYNSVEPTYTTLNLKYYHYIERFLRGVVTNEVSPNKVIRKVLKNEMVKKIWREVLALEERQVQKFDMQDLKMLKLVSSGHTELATQYIVYLYDENSWLRKLRMMLKWAVEH